MRWLPNLLTWIRIALTPLVVYLVVGAGCVHAAGYCIGGTALAWDPACATALNLPNGGGPHQFFKYCDLTLPDCQFSPPTPGTERCETAWGLDPVNGYDGISKNEPGWFATFFNSSKKPWGWVFRYQVTN